MDIPVHNQILWKGSQVANIALGKGAEAPDAPVVHFPSLVRGSWCNDMNQASELFKAQGAKAQVDQFPERFFHQLWDSDSRELLNDVEANFGLTLRSAMERQLDPSSAHLDDVGLYLPQDHIDSPADADSVAMGPELGLARNVHDSVHRHAAGRLFTAMRNSSVTTRVEPALLTRLGRALHTLQDYFSHTNHVELLLWHLADRGQLSHALVRLFNERQSFLAFDLRVPKQLVLRGFGSTEWSASPIYFPYQRSVSETPVVSGAFEILDTIYSALTMYRRHLLSDSAEASKDDLMLSLAFGLIDFPRKDLVQSTARAIAEFGNFVDKIGRAVRKAASEQLTSALVARLPAQEREIRQAVELLTLYHSTEADDWARAGKLAYLERQIELVFLKKYENYDATKPMPVPNHTLLNKDHLPTDSAELVKYNLATWLGARVTAAVLQCYFGGAGFDTVKSEVLEPYFRHPSRYTPTLLDELAKAVPELTLARWQHVPAFEGLPA